MRTGPFVVPISSVQTTIQISVRWEIIRTVQLLKYPLCDVCWMRCMSYLCIYFNSFNFTMMVADLDSYAPKMCSYLYNLL